MLALFVKIPTMERLRKIRSLVFLRIPNTVRITVRYYASNISASYALEKSRQPYW